MKKGMTVPHHEMFGKRLKRLPLFNNRQSHEKVKR